MSCIFKREPVCTDLHQRCLMDAGVSSARMSHPLCWGVEEGPGIAHKIRKHADNTKVEEYRQDVVSIC